MTRTFTESVVEEAACGGTLASWLRSDAERARDMEPITSKAARQ